MANNAKAGEAVDNRGTNQRPEYSFWGKAGKK